MPMPDDLRIRIVAALRKCELKQSVDYPTYFDLADAVIRELQLTVLGDGIVVGVIHE